MPAADDHQEHPSTLSDEVLGGILFEAPAPRAAADDLDHELARLLADNQHGRPAYDPHDPLPGW
jgi:hypothetical protein